MYVVVSVLCLVLGTSCFADVIRSGWSVQCEGYISGNPAVGEISGDETLDIVCGDNRGNIYAFDGKTKQPLWKTSYPTRSIVYSSPAIADIDNSGLYDIYVTVANGRLYRLNGRTGQSVWQCSCKGEISSSPAVVDMNRDTILDIVVTTENGYLHIINGKTGTSQQTIKSTGPIYSTPCVIDLTQDQIPDIIIGAADGFVYAYNGATGTKLWSFRSRGRITGSAAVADINQDGVIEVVIGSEDNRVYCLNGNTGEMLWQFLTGGVIAGQPALYPRKNNAGYNLAVVSADNMIYFLDGESGTAIWNMPTYGISRGDPVLADVNNDKSFEVVVGCEDGKLRAYHPQSGEIIAAVALGRKPLHTPLIADVDADGVLDIVVAAGEEKRIYVAHTSTMCQTRQLILPMIGANLRRTGLKDDTYATEMNEKIAANRKRIDRLYNQAISAMNQKNWSQASTLFSSILALNPRYKPAEKGLQKISAQQHLGKTIVVLAILGIIILAASWFMFIMLVRSRALQNIREMLDQNLLDEVLAQYPGYINRRKKYKLGPALAKAFAVRERYDDLAVAVYTEEFMNPDGTMKPDLALMLAKAYAEREKYDEQAIPLYQEALRLKRNNPYFLRALGRAYRALNDYRHVVELFEKLAQQGERDPEVLMTLAQAYLELNRTDDIAMNLYAEAYPLILENQALVGKLAQLYLLQGKRDAHAVELYQRAVQWDPKCIEFYLAIARYYLYERKYQEAITNAKKVLEFSPANKTALRLLGQAYLGMADYPTAVMYLEKVYESEHTDRAYIQELATAYAHQNDLSPRAISLYQRAVADTPQVPIYHLLLAKAYVEQGELNLALEQLQAYEKLNPTDTELISALYQNLLEKYPTNPFMHQQIIPLYLKLNRIPEALHSLSILAEVDPSQLAFVIQGYTAILDKDPNNLIARLERAKLYLMAENLDAAIADFEVLLAHQPKNKDVIVQLDKLYTAKLNQDETNLELRFRYGKILFMQGEIDRAIAQFQKTLRSGYNEPESTKYLGLCFQKKGLYDLAYRQLSKLQLTDEVKESLYEIGCHYMKQRQYAKAIIVFEQIFSVDVLYKDVKDLIDKLRTMPIPSAPTSTATRIAGISTDVDATVIDPASVLETKTRYEIIQEIGRGNMGIICLARDKELDELVALKFLPDELIYDQTVIERFKQEVRSARRLAHPHIVHIYDLNEELGRRFISMEYIKGENLKDMLAKKKKFSPKEVIDIALQICAALDYAHSMKIVHRDIKPANIMLTETGQVKITDFGIATMLERAGLTQTGSMIGTPLYMSPEQTEGAQVDGRSDLYSLGVMLYELVTGSPPFSTGNISYQHVHVKPQPPKKVPESLSAIIMKCLEKDPNQRYQTAKELMNDLEKIAHDPNNSTQNNSTQKG
ncbi:MAG: protein kinase [bacterium]|nr:protein kinase [bacterium]